MSDGYKGAQTPSSGTSEFNAMTFLVTQILNRANISTLAKVKAVTNSGGVSAVGFVDVQPLIAQLDGDGNAIPHGVLHRIPYFRTQGGADAVILDPKVGDIGICIFADRDISSAKAAKDSTLKTDKPTVTPGSGRRFDMADGMYLGGLLNGIPSQYVQFSSSGINIVSPTKITLQAPETDIIGALKNNGVNVGSTHVHGGVSIGGANTSGPT